ncbi:hypothetical protein GCM10028784_39240 [Myceligenerans cantabricum]
MGSAGRCRAGRERRGAVAVERTLAGRDPNLTLGCFRVEPAVDSCGMTYGDVALPVTTASRAAASTPSGTAWRGVLLGLRCRTLHG